MPEVVQGRVSWFQRVIAKVKAPIHDRGKPVAKDGRRGTETTASIQEWAVWPVDRPRKADSEGGLG